MGILENITLVRGVFPRGRKLKPVLGAGFPKIELLRRKGKIPGNGRDSPSNAVPEGV